MRRTSTRLLILLTVAVVGLSVVADRSAEAQTIFYVNAAAVPGGNGQGWGTAFNDLQPALAAAAPIGAGGTVVEVWVAAGTYRPGLAGAPTSTTFELPDRVQLYGGFVGAETLRAQARPDLNTTILSGDLQGNDLPDFTNIDENVTTLVTIQNVSDQTGIDGFKFEGVRLYGIDATSAPVFVSRCRFVDLYACVISFGNGGNNLPKPVISECWFERIGSQVVLVGTGQGLVVNDSTFVSTYCPMIVGTAAVATANRCRFISNGTLLVAFQGNATFESCIFSGNYYTSGDAGASAIEGSHGSQTWIMNCTFTGNTGGAAVVVSDRRSSGLNTRLRMANCIFWSNPGGSLGTYTCNGCLAGADRRLIAPSITGIGTGYWTTANSNTRTFDPLFVDADGPDNLPGTLDDDLRLGATSQAIDEGFASGTSPSNWSIGPYDLTGGPRNLDGDGDTFDAVDLGAYEFTPQPPVTTKNWANIFGGDFVSGPNWSGGASPSTTDIAFFDGIPSPSASAYSVFFSQTADIPFYGLALDTVRTINLVARDKDAILLSGAGPSDPSFVVGRTASRDARATLVNQGFSFRGLKAGSGVIADAPGSIGTFTVANPAGFAGFGVRTEAAFSRGLVVAGAGTGTMSIAADVANFVRVPVTGDLVIGSGAAAVGALSMSGEGALMTVGGLSSAALAGLTVGDAGAGTLTMTSSADLAATSFVSQVVIGDQAGSTGTLNLSGAGTSAALTSSAILIGHAGQATINISSGAHLTTSTFGPLVLAQEEGSVAAVNIDGAGSRWTETASTLIGAGNGRATISVRNGGELVFPTLSIGSDGTVSGNGTISGVVLNLGTIAPGTGTSNPATLTVNGNYRQISPAGPGQDSGYLAVDVGGLTPGTQHDQLVVTGDAELGGGLIVQFINGFVPSQNDPSIKVVNPTGITTDTFDVAFLPALPTTPLGEQPYLRVNYGQEDGGVSLGIGFLGGSIGFGGQVGTSTEGIPTAAAVGELDGINGPDLAIAVPNVVANMPGSVFVFYNAGTNGLGDWLGFLPTTLQITVGVDPSAIAIGNLDMQNRSDIAVANRGSDNVSILINNGGGVLTAITPVPVGDAPTDVDIGDITTPTASGFPDLVVANAGSQTVTTHINNENPGSPQFFPGSIVNAPRDVSAKLTDIDNDKDLDLVVLTDNSQLLLHTNNGAGAFTGAGALTAGEGATQVRIGDLNNDGRNDLITTNGTSDSVSVLLNTTAAATISFAPGVDLPVGDEPRAIAIFDMEGDGDNDLAVIINAPGGERQVQVLRNDLDEENDLAFVPSDTLTSGSRPLFVLSDDVDVDGRREVITVNEGGELIDNGVVVLPNTSTAPPPPCGNPDFDGDGDQGTDLDIEAFFACLGGDCCETCGSPDFDQDGDQGTDLDIEAFFRVLGGGTC